MGSVKQYENDQWTLELETLGFEKEAKELARMIVHCRPPFAICVRGRWGSGKTSIMRYAMVLLGDEEDPIRIPFSHTEKYDENFGGSDETRNKIRESGWTSFLKVAGFLPLAYLFRSEGEEASASKEWFEADSGDSRPRINSVWFSPWRYQNDPNPMVPLLHTLRNHFSWWAKTRTSLDRVARASVEAGLEILGHLADSAAGIFGVKTKAFSEIPKSARRALERLDREQLTGPTDTERFNLLFEHAVGLILGVKDVADDDKKKSGKDVDDDDKKSGAPSPDAPHHRLVVFIDDLDRCEGEKAVQLLEAIKLYLSTKHCVFVLGVDQTALEHEIRVYWQNRPHGMACEYLEKLFQAAVHVPVSTKYAEFIAERLKAFVGSKPKDHQRWETISSDDNIINDASTALAAVLEPNPRKVKNFLNSLFVAIDANHPDGFDDWKDLLRFALIQRMKLCAPNAYNLLAQGMPETHNHLRDFFVACTNEPPYNPPFSQIGARDAAVFMNDFGHLVPGNGSQTERRLPGGGEQIPGELGIEPDDLLIRLGRIRSDYELARIWFGTEKWPNVLKDYNDFKRLIGLPVERETNPDTAASSEAPGENE